ncbi:hypothetical protein [Streptomyces lavendofoliae]
MGDRAEALVYLYGGTAPRAGRQGRRPRRRAGG